MVEMHKNKKIAHRDIKLSNLFLHVLNTGEHVYKIADFGFAKCYEQGLQTICGTPEYAHPNIIYSVLKQVPTKLNFSIIDLWSIGVTLYHLATGRYPFRTFLDCRDDMETLYVLLVDSKYQIFMFIF